VRVPPLIVAIATLLFGGACSTERTPAHETQRTTGPGQDATGELPRRDDPGDGGEVVTKADSEDAAGIFPVGAAGTTNSDGGSGGDTDETDDDLYEDRVDVVIAAGKLGRTLISCDAGHTWKADTSKFPEGRCGVDPADCDHNPWSLSGLVIQDGYALTAWGHDQGGAMLRSPDGVTWASVQEGMPIRSLVQAGDTLYASGPNITSVDVGTTWQRIVDANLHLGQYRAASYVKDIGTNGRLFSLGDAEGVYSDDFGVSWKRATFNDGCTHGPMISFPGRLGVTNADGTVCASNDEGVTWNLTDLTNVRRIIKVEDKYWLITRVTDNKRRVSTDGLTWSDPEPLDPVWKRFDIVTYLPWSKSFIAIQQGYLSWYDKQFAWVSNDGDTWTQLTPEQFQGGHPITSVVSGKVRPSEICPKPVGDGRQPP
jgi:hypothetical protein